MKSIVLQHSVLKNRSYSFVKIPGRATSCGVCEAPITSVMTMYQRSKWDRKLDLALEAGKYDWIAPGGVRTEYVCEHCYSHNYGDTHQVQCITCKTTMEHNEQIDGPCTYLSEFCAYCNRHSVQQTVWPAPLIPIHEAFWRLEQRIRNARAAGFLCGCSYDDKGGAVLCHNCAVTQKPILPDREVTV